MNVPNGVLPLMHVLFLKVGHSRSLFIYFRLFNTVDGKQENKCSI